MKRTPKNNTGIQVYQRMSNSNLEGDESRGVNRDQTNSMSIDGDSKNNFVSF